ncbi:MAG: energy-coupled thiamine transporter ThiT [Clostridia bacterium]|jgi:thiamine transporter|nr:energy-coupled thiamine transporter ThiT [Clostridia bacterium]
MFTKPFSELSYYEKTSTIALFVTIGIALSMIVVYFYLQKKKPLSLKTFGFISLGIVLGYSVSIVTLLMSLRLIEYKEAGYLEDIFSIKMIEGAINSPLQLYLYTIILVAGIALLALLIGKKTEKNANNKAIVYASICIAMSFALSYVRFIELPQGGSVTFASLLPLMIYAYIFGIRKGVLAGVIYGLLQFVQAPWFYHPVQFLLDYPIAFSAIGLTGLFGETRLFEKKRILQFSLGAIVAVLFRYLSHVVSGIFVFGSGDPDNYNAVAWSFLYNAFSLADMAISLVIGGLLFSSRTFNRVIDPLISSSKKKVIKNRDIIVEEDNL